MKNTPLGINPGIYEYKRSIGEYKNRIHLRLEKRGYQVTAFCSPDGESWNFVGSTNIPTGEPIQPGLHANGHINRLIYPGAYPEGTAIQFVELKLWSEKE